MAAEHGFLLLAAFDADKYLSSWGRVTMNLFDLIDPENFRNSARGMPFSPDTLDRHTRQKLGTHTKKGMSPLYSELLNLSRHISIEFLDQNLRGKAGNSSLEELLSWEIGGCSVSLFVQMDRANFNASTQSLTIPIDALRCRNLKQIGSIVIKN